MGLLRKLKKAGKKLGRVARRVAPLAASFYGGGAGLSGALGGFAKQAAARGAFGRFGTSAALQKAVGFYGKHKSAFKTGFEGFSSVVQSRRRTKKGRRVRSVAQAQLPADAYELQAQRDELMHRLAFIEQYGVPPEVYVEMYGG